MPASRRSTATGLVATAFDHRESRTGDPDLHTHVAVANKVCGIDGKWRSLDARVLHSLGVAASERYNTRFEDAMSRRLGVEFEERPGAEPGKRPVREVVGVPRELIAPLLQATGRDRGPVRRAAEPTTATSHGREPDRSTQLQLAQQATLETREGKASRPHPGRAGDRLDRAGDRGGGSRPRLTRIPAPCSRSRHDLTAVDAETSTVSPAGSC